MHLIKKSLDHDDDNAHYYKVMKSMEYNLIAFYRIHYMNAISQFSIYEW